MTNLCLTNAENLIFLKEAFNILSDESRIKIICMLWKNNSLCVCEIVENLDLKQNLVSHHLWKLKKINLVNTERKGKYIYYKVNLEVYNKLKNLIWDMFNF